MRFNLLQLLGQGLNRKKTLLNFSGDGEGDVFDDVAIR